MTGKNGEYMSWKIELSQDGEEDASAFIVFFGDVATKLAGCTIPEYKGMNEKAKSMVKAKIARRTIRVAAKPQWWAGPTNIGYSFKALSLEILK